MKTLVYVEFVDMYKLVEKEMFTETWPYHTRIWYLSILVKSKNITWLTFASQVYKNNI